MKCKHGIRNSIPNIRCGGMSIECTEVSLVCVLYRKTFGIVVIKIIHFFDGFETHLTIEPFGANANYLDFEPHQHSICTRILGKLLSMENLSDVWFCFVLTPVLLLKRNSQS